MSDDPHRTHPRGRLQMEHCACDDEDIDVKTLQMVTCLFATALQAAPQLDLCDVSVVAALALTMVSVGHHAGLSEGAVKEMINEAARLARGAATEAYATERARTPANANEPASTKH